MIPFRFPTFLTCPASHNRPYLYPHHPVVISPYLSKHCTIHVTERSTYSRTSHTAHQIHGQSNTHRHIDASHAYPDCPLSTTVALPLLLVPVPTYPFLISHGAIVRSNAQRCSMTHIYWTGQWKRTDTSFASSAHGVIHAVRKTCLSSHVKIDAVFHMRRKAP